MTDPVPEEIIENVLEAQRERLVAVARRMLGSTMDAEDAVQEAWLRLTRQDLDGIENVAAWLTTVVGRICIDELRSRRSRPAVPCTDHWHRLTAASAESQGPEDAAVHADSVSMAVAVMLDVLGPAERLAFVLHDVFAVPFQRIGELIGRSTDATKMLGYRARKKVRDTGPTQLPQPSRVAVGAFLAAARDGDFAGLLHVLDPDLIPRTGGDPEVSCRGRRTEVVIRAPAEPEAGGAHSWPSPLPLPLPLRSMGQRRRDRPDVIGRTQAAPRRGQLRTECAADFGFSSTRAGKSLGR